MSKKSLMCIYKEIQEICKQNNISDTEDFENFLIDYFKLQFKLAGAEEECEELEERLKELKDSEELWLLLHAVVPEYERWRRGDYEKFLYKLKDFVKKKKEAKKKKKKKKIKVMQNAEEENC